MIKMIIFSSLKYNLQFLKLSKIFYNIEIADHSNKIETNKFIDDLVEILFNYIRIKSV